MNIEEYMRTWLLECYGDEDDQETIRELSEEQLLKSQYQEIMKTQMIKWILEHFKDGLKYDDIKHLTYERIQIVIKYCYEGGVDKFIKDHVYVVKHGNYAMSYDTVPYEEVSIYALQDLN